ncbi:MAG: DUF421 domain-containing protein [Sphingobacterium sp.]
MVSFEDIFFAGSDEQFLVEIIARTIFMFFLIIFILRISGRRGVRQLTLFEVAIIISLGSAAGDPMFQQDIPIVYALLVFFCVIVCYKLLTWLTARFIPFSNLLEGKPIIIVKNGEFDVKNENDNSFSKMEFFAELRNQSVEHLGQVYLGVLEVDGTLSLLFYDENNPRYGLPLFPTLYKEIKSTDTDGPFACMYCGKIVQQLNQRKTKCSRCKRDRWSKAINTRRIA